MRIGINTRLLQEKYSTGIQNYIVNLYQAINSIDKKNEYLFLNSSHGNGLLRNAVFDNFLISRQIKKLKIDILHAPNSVLPLGPKKCRYLATVHDLGFKVLPQLGRKMEVFYYEAVFKNMVKKADLIISDSFSVKKEMMKYYPISESRLQVVPLGVDRFYLIKEKKDYLTNIKKKYHLNNKRIIFLNSAHSPRKNIDTIVKLFIKNQKRISNTTLVICGAIGKTTFQSLIRAQNKNITVLGYITKKEMRAFYQIADLFLYPSLYEGFGLSILEAMASGCLVLASNIAAFREIITNEEFLFDPLKPTDIYEKIKHYLNIKSSARESFSCLCQKTLKKFSWQEAARKMVNIFNSLKT